MHCTSPLSIVGALPTRGLRSLPSPGLSYSCTRLLASCAYMRAVTTCRSLCFGCRISRWSGAWGMAALLDHPRLIVSGSHLSCGRREVEIQVELHNLPVHIPPCLHSLVQIALPACFSPRRGSNRPPSLSADDLYPQFTSNGEPVNLSPARECF